MSVSTLSILQVARLPPAVPRPNLRHPSSGGLGIFPGS